MTDRLDAQIAFLTEADRLKSVLRANAIIGGARRENSAEHSWHVMLYALVLAEYAAEPIAIERVLTMLMLHDLVEIDAGDAPLHGDYDPVALARAEEAAAERLFGLLPGEQGARLEALWHEFEAGQTADAAFAKAIDRIQTPVANLENDGGTWVDYRVKRADAEGRIGPRIKRGAPAVWPWLQGRIADWFAANSPDGEGPPSRSPTAG